MEHSNVEMLAGGEGLKRRLIFGAGVRSSRLRSTTGRVEWRIGDGESPARGVTLLTGGFNRRMRSIEEQKSPARDDTLFGEGQKGMCDALILSKCRPWRDFEMWWALRCRGLKPPVNKVSPLRGFINTCNV
jgi:hypothetical protein